MIFPRGVHTCIFLFGLVPNAVVFISLSFEETAAACWHVATDGNRFPFGVDVLR